MSKLAKKPLIIPDGVQAKLTDGVLEFSGKEGRLAVKVLPHITAELKDNQLSFTLSQPTKQGRANWGTIASLAKNAVEGVSKGFTKVLEIEGIGYKANMEGANLVLNVGLTHPVKLTPPSGIKLTLEKNMIKVSGMDKFLVGETAAKIRKVSPPEPYKGKGIHYQGEAVRRKAGKKVAGVGAAA